MEEKTSKLEDRVTAALVIYEEHMSDYHTRLILILHMAWAKNQSNDTQKKNLPNHWVDVDAPLQCFGMEIDSLQEDEECVEKRWWSVGLMEEHGSRNVHEKKQNENNGQDETEVWWVELVILHMVLLIVVLEIWYIAVCDATTCSLNSECSETVEDDLQNAVQRWCGQCPCRDALAFSHQKRRSLSTSENFVKNQIACVVKMVLCGRKRRSTSSHLHYLPFSFTLFFFFVTSFLKKYPFPIFHFFPPFPKKILLLMFYLSLLKMFCPWPLQSDKIMQFSSWKNLPFLLIFERLAWSPFYPSFFQELFHIKKMNLFRIFLCFSLLQVFLPSFFHHFLLLFITFRIHLSLSLIFLNNKFPFFLHQKLFNFTFCMHALPLNVLLLFIDLFICCLFFLFLFSVSDFFMKHVFDTSAFPKAFYLFVRHLHTFVCFLHVRSLSLFFQFFFFCVYSLVFLDILLFCSLSWTSVFSCVSFFGYPFWMYPSFFLEILFDLIILFLPVFPFTSSPFFSTTTFFTKLFPCLLSSFKKKKILSPSSCFFTSWEKTLSLKIC